MDLYKKETKAESERWKGIERIIRFQALMWAKAFAWNPESDGRADKNKPAHVNFILCLTCSNTIFPRENLKILIVKSSRWLK